MSANRIFLGEKKKRRGKKVKKETLSEDLELYELLFYFPQP